MDTPPRGNNLLLAGDLAIRARMLEVRGERLIKRQIDFAAYCRTQSAAVRKVGDRCRFPELRATLLRLALSYERIAASTEHFVRRLTTPAAAGVLDHQPAASPDTAEAA